MIVGLAIAGLVLCIVAGGLVLGLAPARAVEPRCPLADRHGYCPHCANPARRTDAD